MGGKPLSTRADEALHEAVEEYARHRHDGDKSAAMQDLLRTGLRERNGPLRSRWRQQIHDWAGMITVAAMVVLAGGVVAPAYMGLAFRLAAAWLFIALAMVGVVEVSRLVTGQSWLGGRVLEVVGR